MVPDIPFIRVQPKYKDLQEIDWWNGLKKYIAEFVAKCPNYQQIKVEHQRPRGLTQDIAIPT